MIYVGTCGYSYKDWLGPFYAATTRTGEMLRYYAECFPAVEIDASYYGVLPPATIERMIVNTPAAFRFCFKAPQTLTHEMDVAPERIHSDAHAFVESVTAVGDAGKLGGVLCQFPNSFKPSDQTRGYLRSLVDRMRPLPVIVEFRNREWQEPSTHRLLCELNAGWCNVDMPSYESLMRPGADVTCGVGYVRFHGRNAAQWWKGDNTSRYDYDYRPEELEPWMDRIAEISEKVDNTFAFFNNHARGNAPRNAELFMEMLRERYGSAAAMVLPRVQSPPAQRSLFQ